MAAQVLPLSPASLMHVIGPIEMAVGAPILSGYTRLGGYLAAIWLGGIAINLVTTGHYFDVAVRDVVMAIAAFTLARLAEAGVGAEARDRAERDTLARTPRDDHRVMAIASRQIHLRRSAGGQLQKEQR